MGDNEGCDALYDACGNGSALSVASNDVDWFQVRAYYTVRVMAFACWATSCVVGVFYVRLITRAANTSTSAELLR